MGLRISNVLLHASIPALPAYCRHPYMFVHLFFVHELPGSQTFRHAGNGCFGRVCKSIWRGTVVAAESEGKWNRCLQVTRLWPITMHLCAYRSLHHPNILALFGVIFDATSLNIISRKIVLQCLLIQSIIRRSVIRAQIKCTTWVMSNR